MIRCFGLDIGMKTDHSALVSIKIKKYGETPIVDYVHKWELGIPLLKIVDQVEYMTAQLHPQTILVDATMNQSIYEELRKRLKCGIVPITITGGRTQNVNKFGGYNVSKIRLIHSLVKTIERGGLLIPKTFTELHEELRSFQGTYTTAGNPKFEAATGTHDDIVMALTLVNWFINERKPMMKIPFPKTGKKPSS